MEKKLYLVLMTIFCCSTYASEVKPNIVLVLVDDAGYADFGFMGSKDLLTPNIDELASNGTVFTDAHVMGSASSPSRAMLMTGRYGQRFGYECNPDSINQGLPKDEIIIPQLLKKNGYNTVCIGKWHLGADKFQQPNEKGFDDFWGFLGGARSFFYKNNESGNILLQYQHNGVPLKFEGYLTDEFTNRAVDYISNYQDKSPFFIYLSYNDPHMPNEPSEYYLDQIDISHKRRNYAAKILSVDTGIGRVVNALKKKRILDETIIIFLSDNGGAIPNYASNYPLKGFKGNKFEGGHRIPFIISWTKTWASNNTFNGLTSSLDILPTLLDVSGTLPVNELDGVSLIPHLTGISKGNPHKSLFWKKVETKAMRYENYKLIMTNDVDTVLYDLNKDLIECNDIKNDSTHLYHYMLNSLLEWERNICKKPLWVENKYRRITQSYHKRLMNNEIFTTDDVRNERKNY